MVTIIILILILIVGIMYPLNGVYFLNSPQETP